MKAMEQELYACGDEEVGSAKIGELVDGSIGSAERGCVRAVRQRLPTLQGYCRFRARIIARQTR